MTGHAASRRPIAATPGPSRWARAVACTTAVIAVLATAVPQAAAAGRPPNFVVILMDDMGWRDVGFMGNTFVETPHIDRLAKTGLVFSQAYASAPNCAPTRACLMSGQYTPRHGIYTVVDPRQPPGAAWHRLVAAHSESELATEVVTLPESLRAAGYATSFFGMWNLGRGRTGPVTPGGQGFDTVVFPENLGFAKDAYFDEAGRYLSDRLTDSVLEFVEKNRERPFFVYLADHAVHAPFEPKPELLAKYERKARAGTDGRDDPAYAATIEAVDENVGRIVAALRKLRLTDDTLVIFTSDNGGTPQYTAPLKGSKGQLYEGGIRVPLVVSWPGIANPGKTSDVPVTTIDLYPTFLELAGAATPPNHVLDGMSLAPLLRGAKPQVRGRLFWHFPCYVGRAAPASAVREGDFKLIEFFEDGGHTELYNLRDDPGEQHDLAAGMPDKARALTAALHQWQRETGAAIPREANPAYDPKAERPRGGPGGKGGPEGRGGRGGPRGRGAPAGTRNKAADNDSLPALAKEATDRAVAAIRDIATEGGWVWRYAPDLEQRAGESRATPSMIWVQPPGTPSVGMALLRAHAATGDRSYLDAAKAAADALATGQLESGGWDYSIDFDPDKSRLVYRRSDVGSIPATEAARRFNVSTFDDDTTQSAVRFLLAVVDADRDGSDPRDRRIRVARDHALARMLDAQYPNGAWPQRYDGRPHTPEEFPVLRASVPADWPREWPRPDYKRFYTLNDGALRDCVSVMLDAHRRLGGPEYLEAARRAGDFLLLAQLPDPQPAWAQQYDAAMHPAWARAFEPPAVTAGESAGAVRLLVAVFRATGDEKYLAPIPQAIGWWRRSEIAPGRWARYYELGTNRPIYGDRDGRIHYDLDEISDERRRGYAWQGDFNVAGAIRDYEKAVAERPRGGGATTARSPTTREHAERAATLAARVRAVIAALDDRGRWVTTGKFTKEVKGLEFGDRIETQVFIDNLDLLSDYLAATRDEAGGGR